MVTREKCSVAPRESGDGPLLQAGGSEAAAAREEEPAPSDGRTAEVGYSTLFSKQLHPGPHPAAPPALLEACPGKELGGPGGKAQVPPHPQALSATHTPHLGTKSPSCVLSSLPAFAGGRQGLWLAQARPELPGHCARAAPSCGGGCRTRLPGPAGQEANIRKYFNHFFKTVKK